VFYDWIFTDWSLFQASGEHIHPSKAQGIYLNYSAS